MRNNGKSMSFFTCRRIIKKYEIEYLMLDYEENVKQDKLALLNGHIMVSRHKKNNTPDLEYAKKVDTAAEN